MVMMDIDRFKNVNDVHGHGYGYDVIGRFTAGFGIASTLASDRLHSGCLTRVDDALYQAKTGVRNRFVVRRKEAPCAG